MSPSCVEHPVRVFIALTLSAPLFRRCAAPDLAIDSTTASAGRLPQQKNHHYKVMKSKKRIKEHVCNALYHAARFTETNFATKQGKINQNETPEDACHSIDPSIRSLCSQVQDYNHEKSHLTDQLTRIKIFSHQKSQLLPREQKSQPANSKTLLLSTSHWHAPVQFSWWRRRCSCWP